MFRAGSAAPLLHSPKGDLATPLQPVAGPPFQYWLPQSAKPPPSSVVNARHDEIQVPNAVRFAV